VAGVEALANDLPSDQLLGRNDKPLKQRCHRAFTAFKLDITNMKRHAILTEMLLYSPH